MTGKIIAVANMKGGVGKTATVVGLAEGLACIELENKTASARKKRGAEVLVIDLDPQSNASVCCAGSAVLKEMTESGNTINGFFQDSIFNKKHISFDDCIRPYVSNVSFSGNPLPVSLLASSSELRLFERELVFKLKNKKDGLESIVENLNLLVKEQLKRTKRSYDYVIIDCPPELSILTELSVRLADMVIVPTIPDFLSNYGLLRFCSNLWTGELAEQTKTRGLRKPKQPYVLITRRRRTKQQDEETEKLRNEEKKEKPNFRLFETEIPEMADIPAALSRIDGAYTFSQKWRRAAEVLGALAEETRRILHGTRS